MPCQGHGAAPKFNDNRTFQAAPQNQGQLFYQLLQQCQQQQQPPQQEYCPRPCPKPKRSCGRRRRAQQDCTFMITGNNWGNELFPSITRFDLIRELDLPGSNLFGQQGQVQQCQPEPNCPRPPPCIAMTLCTKPKSRPVCRDPCKKKPVCCCGCASGAYCPVQCKPRWNQSPNLASTAVQCSRPVSQCPKPCPPPPCKRTPQCPKPIFATFCPLPPPCPPPPCPPQPTCRKKRPICPEYYCEERDPGYCENNDYGDSYQNAGSAEYLCSEVPTCKPKPQMVCVRICPEKQAVPPPPPPSDCPQLPPKVPVTTSQSQTNDPPVTHVGVQTDPPGSTRSSLQSNPPGSLISTRSEPVPELEPEDSHISPDISPEPSVQEPPPPIVLDPPSDISVRKSLTFMACVGVRVSLTSMAVSILPNLIEVKRLPS